MAEMAGVGPASRLSPALRFQRSGLAYAQHLQEKFGGDGVSCTRDPDEPGNRVQAGVAR